MASETERIGVKRAERGVASINNYERSEWGLGILKRKKI